MPRRAMGKDPALAKPAPQVVVVVALVRMELGRPAAAWAVPGPDRRDRPDQRLQGLAVVGVGGGDGDGEGRPARSDRTWIFEPGLPRSTGLAPVSAPPPFSPARWRCRRSPATSQTWPPAPSS